MSYYYFTYCNKTKSAKPSKTKTYFFKHFIYKGTYVITVVSSITQITINFFRRIYYYYKRMNKAKKYI